MTDSLIYVSRITRLPLVGDDGSDTGHVVDVVFSSSSDPPHVNGFVVGGLQRRHLFVSAGRVAEITPRGVRLQRASISLRQFELRPDERLAVGELFKERVQGRRVVDFGLRPVTGPYSWEIATVALAPPPRQAPLRRLPGLHRVPEVLDWAEARTLFGEHHTLSREAAALGGLHPVQMAAALRKLPLERRRQLAAELEDERLADLLEEMPEDEQVRLIANLGSERIGRVLGEMEADDAADLLGEMPAPTQAELLAQMDPDDAEPVRRLLNYDPDTAGGLMTPEPIILSPRDSVADALAHIRNPDRPVPVATQVFVCMPPLETPTGRMLGVVGFQRLLREAPSKPLGRCLDENWDPIDVHATDRVVSEQLAAYNVVAVPVTDSDGRLVGVVTIDDVLDHVLPDDWRITRATTRTRLNDNRSVGE